MGYRNKLRLFLRWRHHLESLQGGRLMSLDDWMQVDQEDFESTAYLLLLALLPRILLSCFLALPSRLLPRLQTL